MKALVYQGQGQIGIENRPKPEIQDQTDAIIKLNKTTICGTDLHILKGDVKTCKPGRIPGHEGIGTIEQIGTNVSMFSVGDKVLISCITACSKCEYCRSGILSHCVNGGWVLGNSIDGTQAEYVRIPHADSSLYKIPELDENLIVLSDIIPTGFECGVLNGKVKPGSTVAIVGAGPIGLAVLLTAKLYSPSLIIMIDKDEHRLNLAKQLGATCSLNSADNTTIIDKVMALTNHGVDTAIEAVGLPETFELCENIVAPGGIIANIGVHGTAALLHLEKLWSHNITITTRLVDTITTPMLLKMISAKIMNAERLISHHFSFENIVKAYDTFANAGQTKAIKIVISFMG